MDKSYPWCSESMKITHRERDDLYAVRRKETPWGGGGGIVCYIWCCSESGSGCEPTSSAIRDSLRKR